MKYWHIYFDGSQYKLTDDEVNIPNQFISLVRFRVFDMAYQYVITLNGNNGNNAYSRWMVR